MKAMFLKPAWLLATVVWFCFIAGGYAWMVRYSFTAGRTSAAPSILPAVLGLSLPLKRPRLLLAIHPHCPCSRASVAELARILNLVPDASDVTVLLYKPLNEADTWVEGGLFDECQRMDCEVHPDPDGQMAASLGGLTSGHLVLYDVDGKLQFEGGITAARGHEGENAGQCALLHVLQGGRLRGHPMPVFGCPIRPESPKEAPEGPPSSVR